MPTPSSSSVYCDYNATSPLREEAREAMLAAMQVTGNPSSVHGFGRDARRLIEEARASILATIGLPDYRIAFTSGASEALATLLQPTTRCLRSKTNVSALMISASEHVAALEGHGFAAQSRQTLAVTEDGLVDLEALKARLEASKGTALVAIQAANNETGIIQPIAAIAALCDVHQALFVCDYVQAAGRLALGDARPAALVVSAHKLGGPAGIGALIFDPMRLHVSAPLIRGGGQERGVRAGTENAIGIAGFAAALAAAAKDQEDEQQRLAALRDGFEKQLLALHGDAAIFGQDTPRLANTSCFALPHTDAALALMQLDLDGVALSSGAACSSGKVKASHVLKAMGVAAGLSQNALRLSLGFASDERDIERVIASMTRWSAPAKPVADKNSGKNANLAQSAIGDCA